MSKDTIDTSSTLVHKVVEQALRRHNNHIELLNSPTVNLSVPTREELTRRTRIIRFYLSSLRDPLKIRLIQLYFQKDKFTPDGVAEVLSINRSTFFRLRREILAGLTAELGWDI